MANPKNSRPIIIKKETYQRLKEKKVSEKDSFDTIITRMLEFDKEAISVKEELESIKRPIQTTRATDRRSACIYYLSQKSCGACLSEVAAIDEINSMLKKKRAPKIQVKYINLSSEPLPPLYLIEATPSVILDTEFGIYVSSIEGVVKRWKRVYESRYK